jgi:hypothetical protein
MVVGEVFGKLNRYDIEFTDVRGQEFAGRALVVAACGGHNLPMGIINNRALETVTAAKVGPRGAAVTRTADRGEPRARGSRRAPATRPRLAPAAPA